MKKALKTATAVAAASIALLVASAQPAHANDINVKVWQNWLSPVLTYNDATDTFCSKGVNYGSLVVVTLKPVNGVGPSYFRTLNVNKQCWSLARAYEDTRYEWKVSVYNAQFPDSHYTGRFWS